MELETEQQQRTSTVKVRLCRPVDCLLLLALKTTVSILAHIRAEFPRNAGACVEEGVPRRPRKYIGFSSSVPKQLVCVEIQLIESKLQRFWRVHKFRGL